MGTRESFGIVFDSFLEGTTGKAIQARGKDAVIVATFLLKNRFDNMLGLYDLPLHRLQRTLVVIKSLAAIKKALQALEAESFALYDEATEFVWVREMARVRLQLKGEPLDPKDKRRTGAIRLYDTLPANPFLGPFFDRYATELGLTSRRDGPPRGQQGACEGASEGASEGTCEGVDVSPQTPLQEQVPVPSTRNQEITDQVPAPRRTAASPQRVPAEDPDPDDHYSVITAVVTKDILPLRLPDTELMDATLDRCSSLRIACDRTVARKAIDSALFRYYRAMRQEFDLPPDPRGIYHDHVRPGEGRHH